MDGPAVLAGLCDGEQVLCGDPDNPSTMLATHNEREWAEWKSGYRTVNQRENLRFVPLHDVVDQRYAVYFPVRGGQP